MTATLNQPWKVVVGRQACYRAKLAIKRVGVPVRTVTVSIVRSHAASPLSLIAVVATILVIRTLAPAVDIIFHGAIFGLGKQLSISVEGWLEG